MSVDAKLAAICAWLRCHREYDVTVSLCRPVMVMVTYRGEVMFTDTGPGFEGRLDAVMERLDINACGGQLVRSPVGRSS